MVLNTQELELFSEGFLPKLHDAFSNAKYKIFRLLRDQVSAQSLNHVESVSTRYFLRDAPFRDISNKEIQVLKEFGLYDTVFECREVFDEILEDFYYHARAGSLNKQKAHELVTRLEETEKKLKKQIYEKLPKNHYKTTAIVVTLLVALTGLSYFIKNHYKKITRGYADFSIGIYNKITNKKKHNLLPKFKKP